MVDPYGIRAWWFHVWKITLKGNDEMRPILKIFQPDFFLTSVIKLLRILAIREAQKQPSFTFCPIHVHVPYSF